jgi:hypothetical protein
MTGGVGVTDYDDKGCYFLEGTVGRPWETKYPHQVLSGACFGSSCPTTRPCMSHMWAPLITVHKASQSPMVFCHQLRFYVFCRQQKVSLFCHRQGPFMLCYNEKSFVLLQARIVNLQTRRVMQRNTFQIFSKKRWMGVLRTLLVFANIALQRK